MRLVRAFLLVCVAAASCACGSSGASTTAVKANGVPVSGTVAKSCPGPLVVGRPPDCSDRAVFERGGHHWTVHGRFRIRLPRGVYNVTVDSCAGRQRVTISRATTGLRLVPHCAVPL